MEDWPLWLLAALDVLAVHRLTKLVTEDTLTVRPRWAVIRWAYLQADRPRKDAPTPVSAPPPPSEPPQPGVPTMNLLESSWDDPATLDGDLQAMVEADEIEDPCNVPKLAVLVTCRWCASVYLAALAVAGHAWVPDVWLPVAAVLALSSASTLLAGLED